MYLPTATLAYNGNPVDGLDNIKVIIGFSIILPVFGLYINWKPFKKFDQIFYPDSDSGTKKSQSIIRIRNTGSLDLTKNFLLSQNSNCKVSKLPSNI